MLFNCVSGVVEAEQSKHDHSFVVGHRASLELGQSTLEHLESDLLFGLDALGDSFVLCFTEVQVLALFFDSADFCSGELIALLLSSHLYNK